jgi:hypothetical protein
VSVTFHSRGPTRTDKFANVESERRELLEKMRDKIKELYPEVVEK